MKEVIDATVNDDWDYFFRLGWDFPINAIEHYKLDNQAFKADLLKVHQMKAQEGRKDVTDRWRASNETVQENK